MSYIVEKRKWSAITIVAALLFSVAACGTEDEETGTSALSYYDTIEDLENNFRPRNRRLLYVMTPGTLERPSWRNGIGIVVLDPNDDYRFVKRISVIDAPASMSPEQVAGVAASPATNMIYLGYRGGRLAALDMLTEEIVWVQEYDGKCCERPEITPDGKTIVVGSDLRDFWYVLDAETGDLKGKIQTPNSMNAHNLNLSPDGKIAFMSPNGPVLSIGNVETMELIKEIEFTDNVRPFVIDKDASTIYANLNNLLGFEIADVETGKVIKRVEVTSHPWKEVIADPDYELPHGCPSHGIALVNDESEVWIVDGINNFIHIFDNTGETPVQVDSVKTGDGPSWITIGLDGKYAYASSGDVIDTRTREVVAQLKDEHGRLMLSEKLLDMDFRDGRLQRVVSQFGNGQVLTAPDK